jgi:hypothetical protein
VRVGTMVQNRESGLEASRYGHRCAGAIAKAIGAEMVGKRSNECTWNGQRVVIKTAHNRTTSVGVLYHMADRIKAVLGAFEEADGSYRVIQLPIARCAAVMRPTRSQGPSAGRVGMIDRKVFDDEGQLVGVVRIDI